MLKQQVSYPSPLQIETPATRRVCFSGLGANCSANSFFLLENCRRRNQGRVRPSP
jgi:hypothetical protein